MKHIFHGKCKYNNCKAGVYADGLCYKHFVINREKEKRSEREPESRKQRTIHKADMAVNTVAVMFAAILWVVCCAGAVKFGIFCYRCILADVWKTVIIVAVIIAALYLIMRLVLIMFDRVKASKYIFTAFMIIFTVYVACNGEKIYVYCITVIRTWAQAFAESMKGILF